MSEGQFNYFKLARPVWEIIAALSICGGVCAAALPAQEFSTAEEAAKALVTAVNTTNFSKLTAIFGEDDLLSADPVQAQTELHRFSEKVAEGNRLVPGKMGEQVLEVGDDSWPFPVPIIQRNGRWFFDSAAGKDEILNRRIGQNELFTLDVIRAAVAAQREYARRDRDGDQVLEYAQKIASSPGQKDGLYWSLDLDGEVSPLGPLAARAQAEGYRRTKTAQPFHGYYLRVLTEQGSGAPGGKYSYIINGNMIGGFAFVAWPAEYEQTGIMTFIVNQQGRVYQKDLGAKTSAIVEKMKAYNPDQSWYPSPD